MSVVYKLYCIIIFVFSKIRRNSIFDRILKFVYYKFCFIISNCVNEFAVSIKSIVNAIAFPYINRFVILARGEIVFVINRRLVATIISGFSLPKTFRSVITHSFPFKKDFSISERAKLI